MTLSEDTIRSRDDAALRAVHGMTHDSPNHDVPPTYLELGVAIGMTQESARDSVDRLEAAGMVTREPRRHRTVRLTQKGMDRLAEIKAKEQEASRA